MKIEIPKQSKQSLGGGFTWMRTFEKYAKRLGHEIVESDGDVFLVSGATILTRDVVLKAKEEGKKIIFRVDNVPKNSRNRNTGTSRLYDFAQYADLVIYQSNWAKGYIGPFIKKDGPVILNGGDTDFFKKDGSAWPNDGDPQYLYLRYNRDETKSWHVAWYSYQMIHRSNPNAHLRILGNFSNEQKEYNFDFFMGERFEFLNVMENPADIAEVLRGTDVLLAPYFNDACSNAIIEARLCGVPKIMHNGTGGTQQIMDAPLEHLTAEYMTKRYLEEIEKVL